MIRKKTTAREAMHKERDRCTILAKNYLDTAYLKATMRGITPEQIASVKSVVRAILRGIKISR